jgi:hypothetical protein
MLRKSESILKRRNEPIFGFDFGHALRQLATNLQCARASRETNDTNFRLRGRLRTIINGEWAVTSFGLECLTRPLAFRMHWAGMRSRSAGSAILFGNALEVDEDVTDRSDPLWVEAFEWMMSRYKPEILAPGAEPTHPVAISMNRSIAEGWDPDPR